MSEKELLIKAAVGDIEAIYMLVNNTYSEYLRKVVKRHYPACNEAFIEETFSEFFVHLTQRNNKGEYRLRNISQEGSPKTYIARALNNYLNDRHESEARLPFVDSTPDETRTPDHDAMPDSDTSGMAGARNNMADSSSVEDCYMKELMIESLFESLESLDSMKPLERYILLTFLIGERFRGMGRPLKLRNALGEQLGMNVSTLYNNYSDNKQILKDTAKEIMRRALMN